MSDTNTAAVVDLPSGGLVDTASATEGDITPEELAEIEQLLASLLGMELPKPGDPDYYDGPAPTTTEFPEDLSVAKVVANDERALIVLGQRDGTDLVYDFRVEDGTLITVRADAAPTAKPVEFSEPTTRDFSDVESTSLMFDNRVISIAVKMRDGSVSTIGFSADNKGTISNLINMERDTNGVVSYS